MLIAGDKTVLTTNIIADEHRLGGRVRSRERESSAHR